MNDNLGDRMKLYEKLYSGDEVLMPLIPACARLDGRAFSNFTKGLERPFDQGMCLSMGETCRWLVEQTGATIGYTQSDEISLVWFQESYKSQLFFGGKVQKLASVLASQCSVVFNMMLKEFLPEKVVDDVKLAHKIPVFDCRVWSVPNQVEAVNVLIWRQQDAERNSIQMSAQSVYSHKELMNKSCNELQEMLFAKGINWSKYPEHFKNGIFVRKQKVLRPYTSDEIDRLPKLHEARQDPNLMIERNAYALSYDVLTKLENRVEYVFEGAEAKYL